MTETKKTEVNLEMCSGFFRIPTDNIIYNITVLASNEPSTTKVVEKIIEVERIVEVEKKSPSTMAPVSPPPQVAAPLAADNYFERYAKKIHHDLTLLTQEAFLSTNAICTAPEGTVRDLADMARELNNVLRALKRDMSQRGTGGGDGPNLTPDLQQLSEKLTRATSLCPPAAGAPADPAATPATTKTITRYLFDLDTVFQTIYELCTNETVKSHIQNARAKAEEIFDKNAFYDAISPNVSKYPEDDGFLTVPMTDIYTALGSVCTDKATCNLLAKMDKQQATIFLDQFLPLEIPPTEEVTISDEDDSDLGKESGHPATADSDGLASLLRGCQTDLDTLLKNTDQADAGPDRTDDLMTKIEDAMVIAACIHHDVSRLIGENNAPSLGQYGALGLKIKGLETLTETMLSMKVQQPELTYEESLAAGQSAAQRALDAISARIQSQRSATPSPSTQTAPSTDQKPAKPGGEASQDDIDRLLAELG